MSSLWGFQLRLLSYVSVAAVSDGAVQAAGGEHSSVVVSSCVNAVDYSTDLLGSSGIAICRVTNDKFKEFNDFKDLRNTHLML